MSAQSGGFTMADKGPQLIAPNTTPAMHPTQRRSQKEKFWITFKQSNLFGGGRCYAGGILRLHEQPPLRQNGHAVCLKANRLEAKISRTLAGGEDGQELPWRLALSCPDPVQTVGTHIHATQSCMYLHPRFES